MPVMPVATNWPHDGKAIFGKDIMDVKLQILWKRPNYQLLKCVIPFNAII